MNKLLLLATTVIFSAANAGGFEKTILWSGKYMPIGGAAQSVVNDSEAMYFNPAGLAHVEGHQMTANFSPIFSQFEAPFPPSGAEVKGETDFSPVFSITGAHNVGHNLVVGWGVYVPAGLTISYDDVDFSAFGQGKRDVNLALKVVDFNVGLGYKINDNWNVGATWYGTYVNANIDTISATGQYVEYKDLEDMAYAGFRVGTQWSNDKMGVGVAVRFPSDYELEGDVKVTAPGPGATTKADAGLDTELPLAVNLAVHYDINEKFRALVGYGFSNYSKIKDLPFKIGTTEVAETAEWDDLHLIRLGFEYKCTKKVPLRLGYALTTQGTPEKYAKATFPTPGIGHSIVAGSGVNFNENMELNYGVEYSFQNGEVKSTSTTSTPGDYSSMAYAAHLGFGYKF